VFVFDSLYYHSLGETEPEGSEIIEENRKTIV